jgi:lipid-binding SYLF domain-containing protein
MKRSYTISLLTVALSALVAVGCKPEPKTEADAAALTADAQGALESYKAKDPTLQALLDKSVGYAIFPNIGKAGWIIGGSYGRGEVFAGGTHIGYADVSEVSAGFQWGAQNFSQLLIFLQQTDFDKFKSGEFSVGANVSAVALTSGAAGTTDPSKGVIALVDTKGGLMAEAALGGQKLRFHPLP